MLSYLVVATLAALGGGFAVYHNYAGIVRRLNRAEAARNKLQAVLREI